MSDLALRKGDLAVDARGFPYRIEGEEELLQRVRICLRVPRGAFAYDSSLGCRMQLAEYRDKARENPALALEWAREALSKVPHAVPLQIGFGTKTFSIEVRIPQGIRRLEIEW